MAGTGAAGCVRRLTVKVGVREEGGVEKGGPSQHSRHQTQELVLRKPRDTKRGIGLERRRMPTLQGDW